MANSKRPDVDWYLSGGTIRTTNGGKNDYIHLSLLNLDGGTIDMRDGGTIDVSVTRLEAMSATPTKLYVDFNGEGGNGWGQDLPIDHFFIEDVNDSGGIRPNIQLAGINVVKDGIPKYAQYLSGAAANKLILRTDPIYAQSSSGWLYIFTPDPLLPGKLIVTRSRNSESLPFAFGDDTLDSYSLSSDVLAEYDLGTMAGSNRTFTIFGNGHTFTGGKIRTGVTVTEGQTLNINALRLSGFKECAINNKGAVHLSDVTLSNNTMDIVNDGTVYLDGGSITIGKGITSSREGQAGKTIIAGAKVALAAHGLLQQETLAMQGGELSTAKDSLLDVQKLTASGGTVTLKGNASADSAELTGGSKVSVLHSDMQVNTLAMDDATLFLDPAYVGIGVLTSGLNGNAFVGSGSVLQVGRVDGLQAIANQAGFTTKNTGNGGFTVASQETILALGQPVQETPGSRLVVDANVASDGSGTSIPGTASAYFGRNSLFAITAEAVAQGGLNGSSSGVLAVASGAKIALTNARAGRTYTVASGFTDTIHQGSGWLGKNVLLSNYGLSGTGTFTADGYTITTQSRDIRETFPNIIAASSINTMTANGLNDVNSPEAGIRFLSRATEGGLYLDRGDVRPVVNEVSRLAVTSNVQHSAFRAIETANDAMEHHLSRAWTDDKAVAVRENGWHVWATPLHSRTWTHDMGASDNAVQGHLTGLVLGVGRVFDDVTIGLSVNGGGGYSETSGTVTEARDSYDFGGASLYAGWNHGPWNVYASVGYALSNHRVDIDLPRSLGFGSQEADIITSAFTANIKAEYVFETPAVDIIPHAGVRFVSLTTFDHDLEDMASYEADPQNIVEFPVGVAFVKDFTAGSWNLRPQLDLTFVPTVGDHRAETRVSYRGINAEDSVRTRVLDDCAFKGLVGLTASKGDFSLGLHYGLTASSHETDHVVQASFMWEF